MLKNVFCVILSMMLLFAAVPAVFAEVTSGTVNDSITWSYDDTTYTLTISGTGAMPNYTYSEYKTARSYDTYYNQAKKLVIEEGITSIGNCNFTLFVKLETVVLPSSLTSIGSYAFERIGDGGPNTMYMVNIPKSVENIANHAFYTTAKGWITFEKGSQLTTIGTSEPFRETGGNARLCLDCPSTELVEMLDGKSERLICYTLDDSQTLTVSCKDKGNKTDPAFGNWNNGDTVTNYAFGVNHRPWNGYVSQAKALVFEEGIKSLGKKSFYGLTSAVDIKLPSTLTSIEEQALYLNGAKYLSIPSSVTSIGKEGLFSASWTNGKKNADFAWVISSPNISIDAAMSNTNITTTIYYTPAAEAAVTGYTDGKANLTASKLTSAITPLPNDNKAIFYNNTDADLTDSVVLLAKYTDADKNQLSSVLPVNYSLKAGNAEIVTAPAEVDTDLTRIFWFDSFNRLKPVCVAQ
ncbi:MAG: leucine-rich repeat protein [Monoglobaceae bacterium]